MQWQNINSDENFIHWLFIFCHCIYYLFFTLCILYTPLLHSNRNSTAFIRKQLVQINRTHPTSGHNRLYSFHFSPYLSHLKSIFIWPQATFVSPTSDNICLTPGHIYLTSGHIYLISAHSHLSPTPTFVSPQGRPSEFSCPEMACANTIMHMPRVAPSCRPRWRGG